MASIGTESVVIVDQPVIEGNEVNIVENFSGQGYEFAPSGLQGIAEQPNYRVNPKYIVGYVDKLNNNVIVNPLYYNYEILQARLDSVENGVRESQATISNRTLSEENLFSSQEIGKATINTPTENKDKAQKQIQRESQEIEQEPEKKDK